MKKLVALAVAAAITSPLALADNTPDNVGNVTYVGNIVANSPMWQWTVNDYPGGRLDAKPSTATTANGTTTYPLNGQAFIAASGYLPSFVQTHTSNPSSLIGTADITSLSDQNGSAPADITDAQKGAVTFTISASGYDTSGQAVEGKLKLKATELRGARYVHATDTSGNKAQTITTTVAAPVGTTMMPRLNGSCFVGVGSYSSTNSIVSGSSLSAVAGEQSATAFTAWISALDTADKTGSAPTSPYTGEYTETPARVDTGANCGWPTVTPPSTTGTKEDYRSMAGAHVLELTPVELQFSTPLSGAWNSTLTVTAYTM